VANPPPDWSGQGYDVLLVAVRGDEATVAAHLAERFGISEQEALGVVAQAPVTVKRGVELDVARQLEAHLVDVGAEVAVRASGAAAVGVPERSAPPSSEPPATKSRVRVVLSPRVVALAILGIAVLGVCALCHVPTRGGLRVRTVGGGGRGAPALVLLHGYGAPGRDLVGLAGDLREAGLPRQVRVMLPEGIVRAGLGRAWWRNPQHPTEGFPEARRRVFALVRELLNEGTPPEHIVVGGFSQGASLAAHVALAHDPPIGGASVLSGGGVSGFEMPVDDAPRSVRFFISHGRSDQVLGFGQGERLAHVLEEAGHEVEFHPFAGGHTIVPSVRTAIAAFVARLTEAP